MYNPWKLLGVHRETPATEIKARFRELMYQHHPDKGGSPEAAAELTAAYKLLLDEKKLTKYLKEFAITGVRCAACDGKGYQFKQKGLTGRVTTACEVCGGGGFTRRTK